MKKKLMGVLLAVTLLATQAMSVFAAGSIQGNSAVTSPTPGVTISSSVASTGNETVDAAIKAVNTSGSVAALESISELKDAVSGKKLVSGGFFDVKGAAGQITLTGLALSGVDKDSVRVLHFTGNVWEVLKPDSMDRSEGTLVVTLKSFSPVAVVAKAASSSDDDSSSDSDDAVATSAAAPAATAADASGVATSPKTGVVSDWALWMGAAVVLLGIAGFASRKTRA